jgi:hypothetical protein
MVNEGNVHMIFLGFLDGKMHVVVELSTNLSFLYRMLVGEFPISDQGLIP